MSETFSFEPQSFEPRGIRLGVVRGISYGLFGPPGEFVPQARALGAGLVRAYLYWSQVEPEPGQYRWDTVDALLGQLTGDEELWITLCSSSPWGTRQPTDFLPPSPALDQRAYAEFVRQVVRHCVDRVGAGRVRYWQCDNEPSNTDLLWAGTAAEYAEQLQTMYDAVKEADPAAAVVLGGCGYDVFSSEPGSAPRQFFDHVAKAGRDAFDLFSVHLYGDLDRIPEYLATARQFMQAHGYLKPVVVGEHAGPQPFEFPDAMAVMQETFAAAFAEAAGTAPSQSTGELAERAGQDTPERRAMKALYDRMDSLPPRLQMFMAGCPAELEAKRDRINCRQVVMRTAAGPGRGRAPDRVLEPRARVPRARGPSPDDAPADRQAPAARLPGRRPRGPPPRGGDLRPARGEDGRRSVSVPRHDRRPARPVRLRGRPRRARAAARRLGSP